MNTETNILAEQIIGSPAASVFQRKLASCSNDAAPNIGTPSQSGVPILGPTSSEYVQPRLEHHPIESSISESYAESSKKIEYDDAGADSIKVSSLTHFNGVPPLDEQGEMSQLDEDQMDHLPENVSDADFSDFTSPQRLCSSLDSSPADPNSRLSLSEESPSLNSSRSTHGSPSKSRRRSRTVMTPSQTRILLAVLDETYFPTNEQREQLSKILQIPQRTIQVWFQNQRQKAKQFGKVMGSPSTSVTHSPSSGPSSLMRSSGFHSGVPIIPYHPSTTSHLNSFPNNQRPILLYGRPPMPHTELLFYSGEYPVKRPISSEVPIRKRTLPVQSSNGSWDTLSWKYNAPIPPSNLDHHQTRHSSPELYKGYRSASLPITSGAYSTNQLSYYPSERSALKTEPDASPSISLSNLLQSTSLVVKRGEGDSPEHDEAQLVDPQSHSNEHQTTKAFEKFKEEEDQLELPSLLLALRG